ncbi:MAG: hypothetical protein GY909_16010 [Oligoflexia bacterium]|nr:hypothetical protein [Oligoflexia bacterium]
MKTKEDIVKLLSLMLDLQLKRVKSSQQSSSFRESDTAQRVKEDRHIRKIFRELGLPPDTLLKELKELAKICVESESGQEVISQENYIKNLLRGKFEIIKYLPIVEVQGKVTNGLLKIKSLATKRTYESVYVQTEKINGWMCGEITTKKSFQLFDLIDQIMNNDFKNEK